MPRMDKTTSQVEVFLITGQSGGAGGMLLTGLQAIYQSGHSDEWVFNGSAFVNIDDTNNDNQYPAAGQNSKFGIEFALLRKRQQVTGKDILIVKHAIGGTGLHTTFSPNWSQTLQDDAKTTWDTAVKWLHARGVRFERKAHVWYQGEKDASDATATTNYEANELAFLQSMQLHMDCEKTILVQINTNLPVGTYPAANVTTVNAAKVTNAATESKWSVQPTGTLTFQGDDIHLDADGYETLAINISNGL